MKISLDDLRDKYLQTKSHEKGWIWTYYVRRPISYYLAIFFLYFNISANKVTLLFLFTGIIGSLLLAIGDYMMFIVGALLIELAIILDCVDGNIARVKGPTITGEILDIWGGGVILILSTFMLGIGLYNKGDSIVIDALYNIIPNIHNVIFIYTGSIAALVTLAAWTARYTWRVISHNLEDMKATPANNIIKRGIENIFHYSGAYPITMLIAAIFNMLDLLLLTITVIYGTNLIVVVRTIMKKAKIMDAANPAANTI